MHAWSRILSRVPRLTFDRSFACQKTTRKQFSYPPLGAMAAQHTKVLFANPDDLTASEANLKIAADLLRDGGVVAFPTETVYGLGANALSEKAVKKIFEAKNRPADNPLIVHVSDMDMLATLVSSISPQAQQLMTRFWPGPLTFLLPKKESVPEAVTCGQPTVAIRMPSHPIARELIRLSGVPVAAPSANMSGRPSPTTAQHVFGDMDGRIPCIVDGGSCAVGLESTVIDLNRSPPLVLRPGGVTLEQLRETVPTMELYSNRTSTENLEEKPPTPGLKYRHYSPNAPVLLYEGDNSEAMQVAIIKVVEERINAGESVGLIHTRPNSIKLPDSWLNNNLLHIATLGEEKGFLPVAQGLFASLRELDAKGVAVIVMEGVPEREEGVAIMNRARKAASTVTSV